MSKTCKLIIKDEVNVKVTGIDSKTAYKCQNSLSFMVPYAFHMPAFKLGRWDGKYKFFKKESGNTYLSFVDQFVPILVKEGYHIDLVDNRTPVNSPGEVKEDIFSDFKWPDDHILANEPIMLRDDQAESANIFLNKRYGLMSLCTSYGKTLLCAALSNALEVNGRSIIIVPSTSLVEQSVETYKSVGLDVGGIHGSLKEFGHTHTITTWQSLLKIFDGKDEALKEKILSDLALVIADECHQSKEASKLKEMLCGPFCRVPYRLGLTGTIPKEDFESQAIVAALGPLIHHVPARVMQDKGILAKCVVHGISTKEDHVFKTYPEESSFLSKNPERIKFIADSINSIKHNGNTLILVNSIDAGKELQKMIPESEFIYGKTKQNDRSKTYKSVHSQENKVIIATYKVAAVGINIPRIFNLVLIEPGKSFIRVIQSIGRAIRIAKDKNFARIFDISAQTKFSKRHLKSRKEYYKESEYPYTEFKGNYQQCLDEINNILEKDEEHYE